MQLSNEEVIEKMEKLDFGKGDIFTEMYACFFYIINEKDDNILVIKRSNDVLDYFQMTKKDFEKKLRYSTIRGYWSRWSEKSEEKCKEILHYYKEDLSERNDVKKRREFVETQLRFV